MVKANQRLRETPTFEGDPRTIPAPIGTTPIPEGNVRFNHYTRPENVESIRQHGLLQSRHRDKVGDESVVFMHAGVPRQQDMRSATFVEGYANARPFSKGGQLGIGQHSESIYREDPEAHLKEHIQHMEDRGSVITALGDIPANQIVGIHQPWHDAFRYFQNEEGGRKGVTEGEYEGVADMDDYGPALKAHKIVNAATVMLGGKLR